MSSKCRSRSWLQVDVAGGVLIVGKCCLIAATGIASGINSEHYNKDGDAVDDWMSDHGFKQRGTLTVFLLLFDSAFVYLALAR